jgi:succinate dehydrogenase/fumarate reductase cytochrome b subunit
VAAWAIVSAVLDASRLRGQAARLGERAAGVVSVAVVVWLLVWALGYHAAYGFTPLGGRLHLPQVTEHHRLARHFL